MRLHRNKKNLFEDRDSIATIGVSKPVSFAEANRPAQPLNVKDEIKDAIDAADRSMSKCHAALRRLRSKMKT